LKKLQNKVLAKEFTLRKDVEVFQIVGTKYKEIIKILENNAE